MKADSKSASARGVNFPDPFFVLVEITEVKLMSSKSSSAGLVSSWAVENFEGVFLHESTAISFCLSSMAVQQ